MRAAPLLVLAAACGSGAPKPVTRTEYEIELAPAAAATGLDEAVRVVRARLHGVDGARVSTERGRVIVDLPAMQAAARYSLDATLPRRGQLVLAVVDRDDGPMTVIADHLTRDPDASALRIDAATEPRPIGASDGRHRYLVAPDREENLTTDDARARGCWRRDQMVHDGRVTCIVTGREVLSRYLRAVGEADASLRIPDDHEVGFGVIAEQGRRPLWRTYYLDRDDRLTSPAIARAAAGVDDGGHPQVRLALDERGTHELRALTTAAIGEQLAFVVDDQVLSAPTIAAPLTAGRLALSLGDDAGAFEARELAAILRSGPLPAPLREASVSELP